MGKTTVIEEQTPPEETEEENGTDVLIDTMALAWTEPDDDGVITVLLSGEYQFVIHEGMDDANAPQYTSGLFKTKKDEFKGALELALLNVAKRQFTKRWIELFPEEKRQRAPKRDWQADLDVRTRQTAEMLAALTQGRQPDWAAAGVPEPDMALLMTEITELNKKAQKDAEKAKKAAEKAAAQK